MMRVFPEVIERLLNSLLAKMVRSGEHQFGFLQDVASYAVHYNCCILWCCLVSSPWITLEMSPLMEIDVSRIVRKSTQPLPTIWTQRAALQLGVPGEKQLFEQVTASELSRLLTPSTDLHS